MVLLAASLSWRSIGFVAFPYPQIVHYIFFPYRLGICVYKPETNCQTMTCSPPLTKVLPLQLDPLDGKIKEITPRKSPLIGYPIPSGQL